MADYIDKFNTIVAECGDEEKFKDVRLRQGCLAYFIHGSNIGKLERESLQSQLSEARAHIERLRKAIQYSNDYLKSSKLNSIGHGSKAHRELDDAINETPAQSLAAIKAQAIDEFMDDVLATVKHGGSDYIKWFRLREEKEYFLSRLRQQAKGE